MATTSTLPDIGVGVPLPPELDLAVLDDLSAGQLAYVVLAASTKFSQRMAAPATIHEFAEYRRASGADWSAHEPRLADDSEHPASTVGQDPVDAEGHPIISPRPAPDPPECLWDTVPMVAEMIRRAHHAQDAVVTGFARQLQPMFDSQPEFFGTPEGIHAFNDSSAYFKEVLRFSAKTTKRIHDRMPYVTWNPGQDPTMGINQPSLAKVAVAFHDGMIPAENLDRIIWMDQDLTKYVRKTSVRPEDKDAVLQHFEPTLVEAAEASNPDAFNAARRRWANTIAHSLDADGPPIAVTLRKPADNILRDQAYADGSGRVSVHLTPDVFAEYKNFVVNQLKHNGAPVKTDEALTEWLYPTGTTNTQDAESGDCSASETHNPDSINTAPGDNPQTRTATDHDPDQREHKRGAAEGPHEQESNSSQAGLFDELEPDHALSTATLEDLSIDRVPDAIVVEDQDGNPVSQEQVEALEALSPAQMFTAILLGALKAIFTMDPKELELKKSHGAASTLMIIQDIETAYQTLGIGAIPEAAQRPRGPHGVIPTIIKRPNPDDLASVGCHNSDHLRGASPPGWTGYISEALNIGALHPHDAQTLACDSALVGQIWNNHHSVLNQRRAHRFFTPAQRRAILARDRGCQAPGCTIIAAFCQIHHPEPWEDGGTTDIDNAISLCAYHHGAVHNGKWTIRTIEGTHFFQPAPWLDPTQPLLRNMYWAL